MKNFGRILLAFAFMTAAAFSPAQADTREYTLNVEHVSRTFLVHVPRKVAHPVSLVVALHGGSTNGAAMENFSGLSESSEAYGFIVVYPNGSGRLKKLLTWNGGDCCGYAQVHDINDTAFLRDLIDYMIRKYKVDASRVYVAGVSNGAIMAYRLAAEIPDKIAAIAAVAGTLGVDAGSVQKPVPILHFHGTEDQYIPFEGGQGRRNLEKIRHRPVMETMKLWVNINDAVDTPLEEEIPDRFEDGTRIVRYTWKAQHEKNNVVLYKIIGGGHTWPGRPHMKLLLGTTTREISANDIMWKFFADHVKPSGKDRKESGNHTPETDEGM
jgi:polyhydroxybutyrate depolymerase